MKAIYLLTFFLFLVATAAAQQKRDTIRPAPSMQGKAKMKNELGLSKKQAADLKTSKRDFKAQENKVKADSSLSPRQRKAALKKIKNEKQQKTDSLLTPEQREKLKELKKEKKEQKQAAKANQ